MTCKYCVEEISAEVELVEQMDAYDWCGVSTGEAEEEHLMYQNKQSRI